MPEACPPTPRPAASSNELHPAGVRALTATSKVRPPVKEQEGLFRDGIDVVYTYDTPNGVTGER